MNAMNAADLFADAEERVRRRDHDDPYAWVRDATDAHRRVHGCWAYPYDDGTVLGAVAAAVQPDRVLELGTALGYTACWWAASGAWVDTIERDPTHVRLARENVQLAGMFDSVSVHDGDFEAVLATLDGPYGVIFFDGYEPPADLLERMTGLLDYDGVVVTTNLDLGRGRTRARLGAAPGWRSRFIHDLALSVRV